MNRKLVIVLVVLCTAFLVAGWPVWSNAQEAVTHGVERSFMKIYRDGQKPLWLVFAEAFAGGLFAVFTPYVYSFVPITVSSLIFPSHSRKEGTRNTILFAAFIVLIFTSLGALVTLIGGATGLNRLTENWIFNLFFFRFIVGLGLSLIGAFEISLPVSIIRFTQSRARVEHLYGIFFMALSVPVVTFSSTAPMMALVLILAGKGGLAGPVVGMLGFSLGLSIPFVFPRFINLLPQSVLNNIKVLMGFGALLLGLKFFSKADLAKGWGLLDRDLFLYIWITFCLSLGIYMLGWLRLTNDHTPQRNIYGQEYVPLVQLFIAIAAFTLAVYLLPGLWGAPLQGVSLLLPPR